MSIRPVDLQVIVQKSNDIGKNYTQENSNPGIAQHNLTQNMQKEVRQASEQVNQTSKSEQNSIDKNGSSGNKHMAKKHKRKKASDDLKDDKDNRKASSTSLFDVTI